MQLINSLVEFMPFENHSGILLTELNRPTIPSCILKHWGPSWVENGIKWVNRKIGVHVGRPKWTLVTTWVRVPTWVGTESLFILALSWLCSKTKTDPKNYLFSGERGFLKVGSRDPIFVSNYSFAHFFRQQLDVWTPIFDKFPAVFVHWMKIEHVLFSSN